MATLLTESLRSQVGFRGCQPPAGSPSPSQVSSCSSSCAISRRRSTRSSAIFRSSGTDATGSSCSVRRFASISSRKMTRSAHSHATSAAGFTRPQRRRTTTSASGPTTIWRHHRATSSFGIRLFHSTCRMPASRASMPPSRVRLPKCSVLIAVGRKPFALRRSSTPQR